MYQYELNLGYQPYDFSKLTIGTTCMTRNGEVVTVVELESWGNPSQFRVSKGCGVFERQKIDGRVRCDECSPADVVGIIEIADNSIFDIVDKACDSVRVPKFRRTIHTLLAFNELYKQISGK